MSNVFAGSNGSFRSAWQLWKRRNYEYESVVMAYKETMVFRTAGEDGGVECVWCHGIDQEGLPEGVELDGVTVQDSRS